MIPPCYLVGTHLNWRSFSYFWVRFSFTPISEIPCWSAGLSISLPSLKTVHSFPLPMGCLIFLCCHTRLFVTSPPNTAHIHNALWCSVTCSITYSFFSLESLRSSYFSCVTHCSKTLWHKITIYSAHGFSGSGIRTGHSGDDLSLPPWRMFGLRPGEHKGWERESSEGSFTHVSGSWCPLSAGGLSFSPHEPLHVVSPHGLVWAFSQHGGCVPRVSVL